MEGDGKAMESHEKAVERPRNGGDNKQLKERQWKATESQWKVKKRQRKIEGRQ